MANGRDCLVLMNVGPCGIPATIKLSALLHFFSYSAVGLHAARAHTYRMFVRPWAGDSRGTDRYPVPPHDAA